MSPGLRHRKCRPFGVKLPDFIPRQYTLRRYSLFWATVGRCPENAASLPDDIRVFCAVVMTMTMSTCFCRKSRAWLTSWCWPPPSPRSRASCFTTCLCLELVGETVCTWSARRTHTIRKTDDITCVLRSCDDDDNEHVLLSKIARLVSRTAWCWPPSSPRSRASCFTTCLCLELVGETVCTWSARRTIPTTATASTSGVRVADPTRWVT